MQHIHQRSSRRFGIPLIVAYACLLLFTVLVWNSLYFNLFILFIFAFFIDYEAFAVLHYLRNGSVLLSILATTALPFVYYRQKSVAAITSLGLGMAILFGYPLAMDHPIQTGVVAAMEGDIAGGPYSTKNIAYYSAFYGDSCGAVCLDFLFKRGVEEFTAYKLVSNTDWYRRSPDVSIETRSPPKIGAGRTYRLTKQTSCPDPRKQGANGRHTYLAVEQAPLGTCLIGSPASAPSKHSLHIVVDYRPSGTLLSHKKRVKRFWRLWILSSVDEDTIRFTADRVLSRRTKIKYLRRPVPFFYPSDQTVYVGDWSSDKSKTYQGNPDTAPLVMLSEFFPDEPQRADE